MSYTEIHVVSPSSYEFLGETHNAWRGAMYVWNEIAKKYFGLECFPSFDESMQRKIWNAGNEHDLTDAEFVVLATTMDHASVMISDAPKLVDAFREYAQNHPHSSLAEQADIIEESLGLLNDIDGQRIMWTQTSVCKFGYLPISFEELDVNELREMGVDINAEDFDETAIAKYADLSDTFDVFKQFDGWKKWVAGGRNGDYEEG